MCRITGDCLISLILVITLTLLNNCKSESSDSGSNPENAAVIYIDPSTDPYTPGSGDGSSARTLQRELYMITTVIMEPAQPGL